MINSIQYGMAGLEVLEVLRAQLGIINKSLIKNYLGCKRIFLLGIVRAREVHCIWEKVEVIMLVKSNRISMIHLISLNKANRQKRRRNKKRSSLYKESSFLRYIDVSQKISIAQPNSHKCKT